jgi:hypothetical protein
MKSLDIVGSNNSKVTYIIDNQINEILNKYNLQYQLYKTKYQELLENPSNINDCKHLLKQLIDTFYYYNNSKTFDDNLNLFIIHLNNTHTNNIYYIIYSLLENNGLLDNIKDIIKHILKLFNLSNVNIDSNIYMNLIYLITLIETNYNTINLDELKSTLNSFNDNLETLKIIQLKKRIEVINYSTNYCNLIKPIINNIDLLLENYNFLKGNILKIEYNINIITKNLNNIYFDIVKND